ncbi:sulfur carrier protein ThiS [Pseudalkalibacillus hwajinpoensis]|uniref:Sulfur carrier protein ThiS n=1 Tax=Guptibacillus hwajinpoensis TaxID=208199 RepID=A0A4U1MHB5_9BACL|nr:sulfur carrier protein ThiS [Pseudalkalibacillus hwajinpoensis]TKD70111.1 sulfur carrier protein ThiS [Pseudalkalibacillus hwajinpoensis]
MNLLINGETYHLDVTTLKEVVTYFGLQEGLVVTEIDGKIIDRSKWLNTKVEDGMTIELVHFVGGG